MQDQQQVPHGEDAVTNKLFITEILNDLHRNGFVRGGKAQVMLHEWAAELRDLARPYMKPSKLRQTHKKLVGKNLW